MSKHGNVELTRPGVALSGETYASFAEGIMKAYMRGYKEQRSYQKLTTSKLRGIYSLIMNVYTKVNSPEEYERHRPDIQYLKVRMAYESGRDSSVDQFLKATHLMDLVDAVGSLDQLGLYCRYAEALVAYFKFYGGRDS